MLSPDEKKLSYRLEQDFDVASVVLTGRAALGLMAVLRCWLESGKTGRVALPTSICQDVVAAVLGAGCEPFFCDMDPINGHVPDSEWARARAAGSTVALVVHLYGNPVDMSVVRHHFPSPDCLLIDDAAQALGSKNSDGLVGGQGDVGLLSFGATKHIEVGGAALLFRDTLLADQVAHALASIKIIPETQRVTIHSHFRQNLESARERLRSEGDSAAIAFHGLLDGYEPLLHVRFPSDVAKPVYMALENYAEASEQRTLKATAWAAGLKGSGLVPVGMGVGAVPWRYACRLPGIDWDWQHRLGEAMRAHGLNVSHWYLPVHWMCGYGQGTLLGAERISREAFQFWVDEHTSFEMIEHGAAVVTEIARSFSLHKQEVDDAGS